MNRLLDAAASRSSDFPSPLERPTPRGPADPAQVLVALSLCDEASEVGTRLGDWLSQVFAPCRCRVLLRTAAGVTPVFGQDDPAPVGGARPPGSRQLLLPIRHGDSQLGAIQLELDRGISGDQRRWLAVVVQAAAAELARLEAVARARSDQRRAEELERYVPGAISDRIQRGEQATDGERDVSVLFLDIRGYMARVSLLRCSQVFRLINRYVRAASAIVRSHGGTVTEFNGDGLMAVFGSPEEIPHKERAAMHAALALAEQVPPLIDERRDGERLAVGIGVASGRGFVGDVVAEDRLIWTTVGHTTNLAARLQAMTRDLATPVLVDEATWRAAGELGAGFERHERLPVRGFAEPVTVYALRSLA